MREIMKDFLEILRTLVELKEISPEDRKRFLAVAVSEMDCYPKKTFSLCREILKFSVLREEIEILIERGNELWP
ncbi:MAG: hypothetical protein K6G62_00740 [Eubacterium sp.]|nr:hypothetical protein [Eubacterium sp.]